MFRQYETSNVCLYEMIDHFILDNQSVYSSLEKVFLQPLSCLQFFVLGWGLVGFPTSTLACLWVSSHMGCMSCLDSHVGETFPNFYLCIY